MQVPVHKLLTPQPRQLSWAIALSKKKPALGTEAAAHPPGDSPSKRGMNAFVSMKVFGVLGLLFLTSMSIGQDSVSDPQLHPLNDQIIVSKELPNVALIFGKRFHYVGRQRVNLYGNAEAEQYVFVKAHRAGVVERFYWIQFEHLLSTNNRTYDYSPYKTTQIGGLKFIYDVKSWVDYAALQREDPASDGAAVERLLTQYGFAFPKKTVRVRMFYLPTPDHRSELMIIYGESLHNNSHVPVRNAE